MTEGILRRVEILFGSVELRQRYIERDGWLQHQSMSIYRDTHGAETSRTEWKDCGGRIKLAPEARPSRWQRFKDWCARRKHIPRLQHFKVVA